MADLDTTPASGRDGRYKPEASSAAISAGFARAPLSAPVKVAWRRCRAETRLKIAGMSTDLEKRSAIEEHWAASEAGDTELEHRLYAEDAVLDYPQSGERFVGRSTIAEQRTGNPSERHFTLQRLIGSGSLWVSECVITYDGKPTISVSVMEFADDHVAHETQYFADPFDAPASRAGLAQQIEPSV
jgi:hypothetical protein